MLNCPAPPILPRRSRDQGRALLARVRLRQECSSPVSASVSLVWNPHRAIKPRDTLYERRDIQLKHPQVLETGRDQLSARNRASRREGGRGRRHCGNRIVPGQNDPRNPRPQPESGVQRRHRSRVADRVLILEPRAPPPAASRCNASSEEDKGLREKPPPQVA